MIMLNAAAEILAGPPAAVDPGLSRSVIRVGGDAPIWTGAGRRQL